MGGGGSRWNQQNEGIQGVTVRVLEHTDAGLYAGTDFRGLWRYDAAGNAWT